MGVVDLADEGNIIPTIRSTGCPVQFSTSDPDYIKFRAALNSVRSVAKTGGSAALISLANSTTIRLN